MKSFILIIFLTVPLQFVAAQAGLLSGFIKTNSGQAIEGVSVTNGFQVTTSDAQGAYSLPRTDSVEFVYITVPAEYVLPIDDNNLPLFYKKVSGTGNFAADFTLTPFSAEELTADLNHVLIAFGDPQIYNDYDSYLFGKESIEDMKTLTATYPESTHFYGACVGDLVWDQYARLAQHTENCKKLGFPVFQVIGNHDHDRNIRQDWGSDHYFKDNYGPTYYSVNRGNIHYVALDDIEYTNATGDKSYNHNIVDYQMQWLAQDLALTPAAMQVVFLIHAPIHGSSVANREAVYALVNNRRSTHAISGHQHVLRNYEISNKFYDHTLPAVGGLWNGYMQSDGTPPGYAVFQASNNGLVSWFFKSTGLDRNYQMRVYPVGSFVNGESMVNKIIANIWNYDSKWSEVSIFENGAKHIMYQYSGVDPLARDFLMDAGDTRPNYGGTDVGQPDTHNLGASATPHLFYYEPININADFEVEVSDRFGTMYRDKVLKNLMTAAFSEETDNEFYYRQNFDDYRSYPNQAMGTWGKCTYVQGHTPMGWYHAHSGVLLPTVGTTVTWGQYNYIRVSNGASDEGGLYAFGSGAVNVPAQRDSDQAMGSLNTSSAREIMYGVLLENNTGQTLNGIKLSYVGEMWRGGLTPQRGETLKFSYAVNPDVIALRKRTLSIAEVETTEIDTLFFVSPATTNAQANTVCDGNALCNRAAVEGKIAVRLYAGDIILLRWDDRDEVGSDNALAIDNLVVKAITEGENTAVDETQIKNLSFYNVGATVYFDEAPMSTVTLYDACGMIIQSREVTSKTLEMSALPKGVYFLKTIFGTKKIIL